ncbi:MAG TPA: murein biosynthesis integral membrane protein MurJ [Verrucomicrobiae bacterium]|nr:murein biosynthesis integral membrane protein MurJ [Verrucomicrobiae bacterium]
MLKSSGAVGAATLTSRVFGLVREIVFARFMGDSWVASAFIMAFMIPNLFRRLLGEGALTAAFIPVFKEKEKLQGEAQMWSAANAVISALTAVTAGVVIVAVLVITGILKIGIPDEKTVLMLELLRLMFPYLLLVCLAAVCIGILNARGYFFVPALGTTFLNLIMIGSVIFLAPRMGERLDQQVFGLAIGVLAAGLVQMAFQLPLLNREGFRYQWISPWSNDTVHRVATQMGPAILGVAAYQINVLVTQSFAFWTGKEIVASFNYAVRLMELPQGLFGISLATYLLPTLSGLAAEKKYPEFRATLQQSVGYLIFINLLASILLFTLAEPIIRLLFERGRFDGAATIRAASALVWLAPGLVAFSLVNILARGFYALGDTKTPMRISAFCLVVNVLLVATLIWRLRQAGLGLANTLSGCVNVALLIFALRKKLGKLEWTAVRTQLPALLGAGIVAGAAAFGLRVWWTNALGHSTLPLKLGEVFVPMILASAIYLGLGFWLKVPFVKDLVAMVRSRLV